MINAAIDESDYHEALINHDNLLDNYKITTARQDFYAYRQLISGITDGWFPREISHELQQFYEDVKAGKNPILVINTPPQHGKSVAVMDFLTWVAGQDPNTQMIYSSFSEMLGVKANRYIQKHMGSAVYNQIFPETSMNNKHVKTAEGARRNQDVVDFVGHDGFFRNTTVGGPITGESLDIGVVDDPTKGSAAARSPSARQTVWDWFVTDFMTRRSDKSGVIIIMTRWHIDDLVGRLSKSGFNYKLVNFQAVANDNEQYRKKGEVLFPELKSANFINNMRKLFTVPQFESLYQGNPITPGGEFIKEEDILYTTEEPKLKRLIVTVDTAFKAKEINDRTVFLLAGLGYDDKIYLLDMDAKKLEAQYLRGRAISFWNKHQYWNSKRLRTERMYIEDAASGIQLIQELTTKKLFPVESITRSKDKVSRSHSAQAVMGQGRVVIYTGKTDYSDGTWVDDCVEEVLSFSADMTHKHDDRWDTIMDAIDKLAYGRGNLYDDTSWI